LASVAEFWEDTIVSQQGLEDLEHFEYSRSSSAGMDYLQTQSKAHLILSLLYERGPNSRAMFQPDINHHVTEDKFFNESHFDQHHMERPPMMKSFMSADETFSFTLGSAMSFILYESKIVAAGELPPHLIVPQTHLELKVLDNEGKQFTGHGYLHQRKSHFLSEETFEKFIALFGRKLKKRVKYPSDHQYKGIARLEDIFDFFKHFKESNLDWRTMDGFKEFLKAYPRIDFEYNDKLELHQNINLLSYVLQSKSPVRAGVADGQHRMQIYTYCLTRNLEIRDVAPLPEF